MITATRLVCLVAAVVLSTPQSASAHSKSGTHEPHFGQIETDRFPGYCLEAVMEDFDSSTATTRTQDEEIPVRFRPCDADKLQQYWFLTEVRSEGPLYTLVIAERVTRSAAFPSRCLTDVASPFDDDAGKGERVLTLMECTKGRVGGQGWSPSFGREKIRASGKCISISRWRGYLRGCDRSSTRQKYDIGGVRLVDNYDLAAFTSDFPEVTVPNGHPLERYATCSSDTVGDLQACFLEMDNIRYGGRLGTDRGNSRLLYLENQYAMDRCALAHDRWAWAVEDEPGEHHNEVGLTRCFESVLPTTPEENNARELGVAAWKVRATYVSLGHRIENEFCVPGHRVGELPPVGEPIIGCNCRRTVADADLLGIRDHCPASFQQDTTPPNPGITEPAPSHLAQVGDTVWALGVAKGLDDAQIMSRFIPEFEAANPGTRADLIFAGERYTLPEGE